jgi:hypothetical protein
MLGVQGEVRRTGNRDDPDDDGEDLRDDFGRRPADRPRRIRSADKLLKNLAFFARISFRNALVPP